MNKAASENMGAVIEGLLRGYLDTFQKRPLYKDNIGTEILSKEEEEPCAERGKESSWQRQSRCKGPGVGIQSAH